MNGKPETSGTILVVDDDPGNIETLAELLGQQYDVLFAISGSQALDLVHRIRPDLILLDVLMPEMDGYEVCRRLKSDPLTADIPVIFVTALDDRGAESRGLELGALDYITKPFNPAIVRVRARNHVELKQMRDTLMELASSDALTGLANRRRFDEALHFECQRLGRARQPLSLIMLDLDHFKDFNDAYGHPAGDECLKAISGVIAEAIRRTPDIGARYGGEEFACILPETEVDGAVAVAERIRRGIEGLRLKHPTSPGGFVTASLGTASVICTPTMSPLDLVKAADTALYQAKATGRNRTVTAPE